MSFIVFNCYVVEWVDIFANPVFKNPGIIILATISDIFPENPLINLFIYYSAQPVSILTFTGFEKLFQAALKSRSMDHTVKHTKNKDLFPWLRLLTFKKGWKDLGKHCHMAVKYAVNRKGRDEENGSRLAGVLLERP